jgi:hypothetical protein
LKIVFLPFPFCPRETQFLFSGLTLTLLETTPIPQDFQRPYDFSLAKTLWLTHSLADGTLIINRSIIFGKC